MPSDSPTHTSYDRPCTCHPDDHPPVPCPKKYALRHCRAAANRSAEPDYFAALTKAGRIKKEGGKMMVTPKEDTKRDPAELLRRAEAALDAWRWVNDEFRLSAAGDEFTYVGGMNAVEHAREMTEHYVGYKITGQK